MTHHMQHTYHMWLTADTHTFSSSLHNVTLHVIVFNLKEPCVLYTGQAHRYPPNTQFYMFFQQIYVLNFLNMLHTLYFFSTKCRWFRNATFSGSCIIPLGIVCPIYRTDTPLPSKHPILYVFSTNIRTEFFKHAAHSAFFLFKIPLFHNATYFGCCIIRILHTGCAKI
jgi:hypothetical protein